MKQRAAQTDDPSNPETARTRWVITGANGHLGGMLCRSLSAAGKPTLGIMRSGKSDEELVATGVQCHDYEELGAVLGSGDVVVHCAGKTGTVGSWDDYYSTNVQWSLDLYQLATERGAACFVYISSVAALGYVNRHGHQILDETAQPELLAGEKYGRSKLEAERALLDAARNSGTRLIILRPGLVYGRPISPARQSWFRRGVANANGRVPLIHHFDFLQALIRVSSNANAEGIYLIVDDEQPTRKKLNDIKLRLGLLRYSPWYVPGWSFRLFLCAKWVARKMLGKHHPDRSECRKAAFAFWNRRLHYDCSRLKQDTGWSPTITTEKGWAEAFSGE